MTKKIILIFFFFNSLKLEAEDLLKNAREQSLSGMNINSYRISIIAQNIANAASTAAKPGAAPYTRKMIILGEGFDENLGQKLVTVKEILNDPSPYQKRFEPYHPAADAEGYVLYPNVNIVIENTDAKEAEIAYKANMAAYQITKSMQNSVIDILK